jgi:hypothetical protein
LSRVFGRSRSITSNGSGADPSFAITTSKSSCACIAYPQSTRSSVAGELNVLTMTEMCMPRQSVKDEAVAFRVAII